MCQNPKIDIKNASLFLGVPYDRTELRQIRAEEHLMKSIWILDSEMAAQGRYNEILGTDYNLELFSHLPDFQEALRKKSPDMLISEVIISGESFLKFVADHNDRIRKINLLIVSAMDDEKFFEHSIQLGALDYITKPFNANELKFRIKKILGYANKEEGLHLNDVTFTVSQHGNCPVKFTPKEFQILKLIYHNVDKTIDKSAIQKVCWEQSKQKNNTIDVHLYNLRRKLEQFGLNIVHVHNTGYRLVPYVSKPKAKSKSKRLEA
ncbi:MAG: response regulator transcription factor [Bdellovibrionota bacterium]